MEQPNIIFIILDTLRADKVLSYYENLLLTPYIKSLLEHSIYFENCITNSPWTIPSHISMFTGLYPLQNEKINKTNFSLNSRIPILSELLQDNGYFTMCYTENVFITKKFGLNRGFDEYFRANYIFQGNDKKKQYENYIERFHSFLIKRVKSKLFLNVWELFHKGILEIIKFLSKKIFWKDILFNYNPIEDLRNFNEGFKHNINKSPFFIYYNIMTTHTPYIPIKKAIEHFNITLKDFENLKDLLINIHKNIVNVNIKLKVLPEIKIKLIEQLYNACVYSADLIVKNIFLTLERNGILDNAYVIITSDHGEHLGGELDHYLWEHGNHFSLYKSLLRVPLLIYSKSFKNRVITDQVQLKDLFHTILHLTNMENPQNKNLEINKSILHQIEKNSTPKYIFGEYSKIKYEVSKIIRDNKKSIKNILILKKLLNDVFFLRSNDFKLITYNNKIEEFYNIKTDPDEQLNLTKDNNENYREMRRFIENFRKKISNSESLKKIISTSEKKLIKKIIGNLNLKEFEINRNIK